MRSKKVIKYHGRSGNPIIHKDKQGKRFIMVRKKDGGVKRLYEDSEYRITKKGERPARYKRLKL